ncbi:MAG: HEPN domain-containing protein [Rhodoferax sp.]|nr:HEPN domain-containing protein [Rhodoferax sp.]
MGKARQACNSARVLLNTGDVDGACNRAYYAMFDAARAALLASHAPVVGPELGKTHSGLIAAFSLHLVKNGPLTKDIGRLLNRGEEVRLVADYNGDSVTQADAERQVAQAELFVNTIDAQVIGATK